MKATAAADAVERLLARSTCYQALSVLWRHPDEGTVQWLASRHHERLPELIEALQGDGSPCLLKACRRLATALDAVAVTAWTHEYERIFGHSVQSAAPPYELEYGEAHSHRQPQELGDIAAFYHAFGLRISRAAHERVDHIATECEFLQYLLYKQACAADDEAEDRVRVCEDATRQFLTDHLGRWGPAFTLRLSRVTGEGVLGAITEVTLEWLVQDCARMQVPAGPRDLPLRLPNERDDAGCAACALQPPRSGDAAAA